ncbi:MAG: tRNA pseudouridine(38-40) synthase TruA [Clostridiales bacterium]|nr:tRNA pseudouridine(38-40) synthase TruA [Clostridiales bacterium]
MRYKITLSYDGASFCGWQSQPSGGSVQDAVEAAVQKLFGCKAAVVGSGRTDAGVHALAQVAHFDSEKVLPLKNVVGGLNAYLPDAVRVTEAECVDGTFDARKSVKKKTYMYIMYDGTVTPLLETRALKVDELDEVAMNRACAELVGTHDFATFKAAGSSAKTSVRTVFDAHVERKGRLYLFFITADGFLYNMVRIITAQLVKIGGGEEVDIKALMEKRDRTAAKETAPAKGLYLYRVEY